MKIGELFRDRDRGQYPTPDEMLDGVLTSVRRGYPLAKSDAHAMAYTIRTLEKNYAERMQELDAILRRTTVWGAIKAVWVVFKLRRKLR